MNGVQKGALALAVAMSFTLPACAESRQNVVTEAAEQSTSEDAAMQEEPEQPEVVQEPVEEKQAEPLPSYGDMLANVDSLLGTKYHIAGRVTHVGGGFRGDDYEVYVYWDDSQTQGEVAAIVIPYKSYTESVNRYFEGDCTLQGLDDSGHPQFVCYEYIAVEP